MRSSIMHQALKSLKMPNQRNAIADNQANNFASEDVGNEGSENKQEEVRQDISNKAQGGSVLKKNKQDNSEPAVSSSKWLKEKLKGYDSG